MAQIDFTEPSFVEREAVLPSYCSGIAWAEIQSGDLISLAFYVTQRGPAGPENVITHRIILPTLGLLSGRKIVDTALRNRKLVS